VPGGAPDRTGLLGGCLPALLQLPFFSVLYRLLESATIDGRPNGLLSHDLLGVPLGGHWLSAPGPASIQGAVFAGLFVLLAVVGWLSARSARRFAAAAAGKPGGTGLPGGAVGTATRVLPYTTVAVAAVVPLAAGIYLLTSSAWAVAERRILGRKAAQPGPAGPSRRDRRGGGDIPGVIRSA
jgi:YidC/Oxa1 family membrane protein insertase